MLRLCFYEDAKAELWQKAIKWCVISRYGRGEYFFD